MKRKESKKERKKAQSLQRKRKRTEREKRKIIEREKKRRDVALRFFWNIIYEELLSWEFQNFLHVLQYLFKIDWISLIVFSHWKEIGKMCQHASVFCFEQSCSKPSSFSSGCFCGRSRCAVAHRCTARCFKFTDLDDELQASPGGALTDVLL